MTILFPALLVIGAVLIFPAYLVSLRRGNETWWLLFVAAPGVALWVVLTAWGYGPQSLSNLVEVLILTAAGAALSYVKVFALDPMAGAPRKNTFLIMAALAAGAFLLRTFMPLLPE